MEKQSKTATLDLTKNSISKYINLDKPLQPNKIIIIDKKPLLGNLSSNSLNQNLSNQTNFNNKQNSQKQIIENKRHVSSSEKPIQLFDKSRNIGIVNGNLSNNYFKSSQFFSTTTNTDSKKILYNKTDSKIQINGSNNIRNKTSDKINLELSLKRKNSLGEITNLITGKKVNFYNSRNKVNDNSTTSGIHNKTSINTYNTFKAVNLDLTLKKQQSTTNINYNKRPEIKIYSDLTSRNYHKKQYSDRENINDNLDTNLASSNINDSNIKLEKSKVFNISNSTDKKFNTTLSSSNEKINIFSSFSARPIPLNGNRIYLDNDNTSIFNKKSYKNNYIKEKYLIEKEKKNKSEDISSELVKQDSFVGSKDKIMLKLKDDKKTPLSLNNLNVNFPNYDNTKCSIKSLPNFRAYAANTYQGIIRNYNEDRVAIILNISKPNDFEGNWPKCSIFGIYDGHGGANCADFLRDNLHTYIIRDKEFPNNPIKAIQNAFFEAERTIINMSYNKTTKKLIDKSGSCAILTLLIDDICIVANVGDSRAILSKNKGKIVDVLTSDHKPNELSEQERIIEKGGKIYQYFFYKDHKHNLCLIILNLLLVLIGFFLEDYL